MSSTGRRKSALSDQLRFTPPEQRILSASSGDLTSPAQHVGSSLPARLQPPSSAVPTTASPSIPAHETYEIAIAPANFGSLSAANRSGGAYGSFPKELSSSFFGGGGSVTSRISSSYLVRPNIPATSQIQSNLGFNLGASVSNNSNNTVQAAPQQMVSLQPPAEVRLAPASTHCCIEV